MRLGEQGKRMKNRLDVTAVDRDGERGDERWTGGETEMERESLYVLQLF